MQLSKDVLAGSGALLAATMRMIRNSAGSRMRCSLRHSAPWALSAAVCSRCQDSSKTNFYVAERGWKTAVEVQKVGARCGKGLALGELMVIRNTGRRLVCLRMWPPPVKQPFKSSASGHVLPAEGVLPHRAFAHKPMHIADATTLL